MPFSKVNILSWQKDYCINFAIALSRITGWILHIDYWKDGAHQEDRHERDMVLLRVYIGDNKDNIFDVTGIKKIEKFNHDVIRPLIRHNNIEGGVLTRFYSEDQLANLPIKAKPEESKILSAMEKIKRNKYFLDQIPQRKKPMIPAHIAAKYTYGRCSVYAEALQDIRGVRATAMIATDYKPQFEGNKLGYIHSIVLDTDTTAEDVWGVQTVEEIAKRFYVAKFELSEEEHKRVIGNLKKSSPKEYDRTYNESVELIRKYVIGNA